MNRVFLMGNLTRDPVLRKTQTGMSVGDMGLAISERYKSKTGEETETVCFVDIEIWSRLAENCCEYLTKGSPVMVEGSLKLDQWTTDKGEKRTRLRVRAEKVVFLGKSNKAGAELSDAATSGRKQGARDMDTEHSKGEMPF